VQSVCGALCQLDIGAGFGFLDELEQYAAAQVVVAFQRNDELAFNPDLLCLGAFHPRYFSAITNISKSSVVSLSFLEKAPSFAPKISIFI
jgi:hypothetical protein